MIDRYEVACVIQDVVGEKYIHKKDSDTRWEEFIFPNHKIVLVYIPKNEFEVPPCLVFTLEGFFPINIRIPLNAELEDVMNLIHFSEVMLKWQTDLGQQVNGRPV